MILLKEFRQRTRRRDDSARREDSGLKEIRCFVRADRQFVQRPPNEQHHAECQPSAYRGEPLGAKEPIDGVHVSSAPVPPRSTARRPEPFAGAVRGDAAR